MNKNDLQKEIQKRQEQVDQIVNGTNDQIEKIIKATKEFQEDVLAIDLNLSQENFDSEVERCLVSYMLKTKKIEAEVGK